MPTSSSISALAPKRGEIWNIDFDPTRGAEIQKLRPAVVVSSDALRSLPLRLVVPLTGWQEAFEKKISHVKIIPNSTNGLTKQSAADTLQLRGVSLERFTRKRGQLTADEMEEIAAAIAAVVEYQ